MDKRIETTKGLKELLKRYEEAKASEEWLETIRGCINEGLAMDGVDFENTPKELKPLWKGLK